jgi:CBS domain-containing protein
MTSLEPMAALPVRRTLTMLRDGSATLAAMVFCDPQLQSVPVGRCSTCRFGGAIERDALGQEVAIECCRYMLPSSRSASEPPPSGPALRACAGVAQLAAALPIGLSLVRRVVSVAHDAPLRVAARALDMEASAYGVPVVDDEGSLVGILPRAAAALALLRGAADVVADHMNVDWSAVCESHSLGSAFERMTARRARELSVVTVGGALVGTLRDIDALRFVSYVSRTGMRPPVERAA